MVWLCKKTCSLFCLVISVWGSIQLIIMGLCLTYNSLAFLPFLPIGGPHNSLNDFRSDADDKYQIVALRCYVCAFVYACTAMLSMTCFTLKGKQLAKINNQNQRRKPKDPAV